MTTSVEFHVTEFSHYPGNDGVDPVIFPKPGTGCPPAADGRCGAGHWQPGFAVRDLNSGLFSVRLSGGGASWSLAGGGLVAGAREEVRGRGWVSCCHREVELVATDVAGNTARRTVERDGAGRTDGGGGDVGLVVVVVLVVAGVGLVASLLGGGVCLWRTRYRRVRTTEAS